MKQKRTLVMLVVPVLLGGGMAWGITRLLEWSSSGSAAVAIGIAVAMAGVVALVVRAPVETVRTLVRPVDAISTWTGNIFGWLIFPLFFLMCFEVVMRYFFNNPTMWSFDVTCWLYGTLWTMGCGYALIMRRHIRIDVFYARFSPRTQSTIDVIGWIVLFFPMAIALLIGAIGRAQTSWIAGEVAWGGSWQPPLYPFKTVLPVAMLLMLLAGVPELLRSLFSVIKGEQL
ncbi:TRAP transporter small permease subunit [Chloroflexota bacterium]